MSAVFEYRIIPAPTRGQKARGLKTPADRFAHAMEQSINEMAAEGWEYLRSDTLPSEERQGLSGRKTIYHNVLVFQRMIAEFTDEDDGFEAYTLPEEDPYEPEPQAAEEVYEPAEPSPEHISEEPADHPAENR